MIVRPRGLPAECVAARAPSLRSGNRAPCVGDVPARGDEQPAAGAGVAGAFG